MRAYNLAAISVKSIFRHKGQTAVLAGGLAVGVASLVFLFSLLTGVESTVRKKIIEPFPETHIRVEQSPDPTRSTLSNIDENLIKQMRKKPEVLAVYPRMKPDFPCKIEVEIPLKFAAMVENRYQCMPINIYGIDAGEIEGELDIDFSRPRGPNDPVPMLVNLDFFDALEKGLIPEHFPFLVKKDIFSRLARSAFVKGSLKEEIMTWRYWVNIGESASGDKPKVAVLLGFSGFSRRIPQFGISVPAGVLRDWYGIYYNDAGRPVEYQNMVVVAKDPTEVGHLVHEFEKRGFAVTSGKDVAEKVTMFFRFVQIGVTLIGLIILILSGVGIFLGLTINVMMQSTRIAILRAVGARRRDIAFVYVFEAAFIGLVGGLIGIGLAFGAMLLADYLAVARLPDFLFKPETFFKTPDWYLPVAVLFGVVVAIAAGLPPALRAARINVARVLR
ncbi:MAG: ABC transporter permease [Planctomycetota bacterium]